MDFLNILQEFSPLSHEDCSRHYRDIYYAQTVQPHHRASWTHEAIAGAAGFAAVYAYEAHLRATGQQPSHVLMKEILGAIAAAEADKLVESKGLDWIDAHRARKMAVHQAHHLANQRYGTGTGWEYAQSQGGPSTEYNYGYSSPFMAAGGGYQQPYYPAQQPPYGGYPAPPAPGGYGYPPPDGYGYAPQPPYPQPGLVSEPQPPMWGDPAAAYAQENHHHHKKHHGFFG